VWANYAATLEERKHVIIIDIAEWIVEASQWHSFSIAHSYFIRARVEDRPGAVSPQKPEDCPLLFTSFLQAALREPAFPLRN
jgi:hypothetical protein